ncbi:MULTISPECIES: alpha/beta hydrolase [Arthrobacter]|uniref:Alpha/beta hydrolase n=1 Tax=Arthrobacter terricola TaxID=2547396 RepID=A0A4R5KAL7_9MICC|nr:MULTISPECIES: alpha/beta hydrolase [Arthrobacter]MBT8162260.1 alpha/beta hydrolase [Arthrobacter sp. GN70]TDF92263.1 alpha/beta hydrolase [Arthrobacter terricola]
MSREQRAAIDRMLRRGPQSSGPQLVENMRENFASMMARFAIPPTLIEETTLGGRSALRLEPQEQTRAGTILYFHGGSFALGTPQTALGLTASLVTKTGMRALSLDYRLAPEHPFPAGIEDCLAAYRELLEDGIQANSIAFAGDSAGGGLAVTTTIAAKVAGLPVPGAIVAFSPGLDHTRTGASMETKAGIDPFFTRAGMQYTGDMYLAGQDPNEELLAPAVYADLTGFPPLLLQVGTNELLLDDSVRLAERARDADVDVILDITANVPHVFQSFIGQLDEADQALDRAALFLTQHLATT